jgi:hypothetical protein
VGRRWLAPFAGAPPRKPGAAPRDNPVKNAAKSVVSNVVVTARRLRYQLRPSPLGGDYVAKNVAKTQMNSLMWVISARRDS